MADVKGGWGRIVWMPTWDAEHYVKNHGNDRPFISVAKDGELLPETKALIAAVGPEHSIVSSDKGQGRGAEGQDGPAQSHPAGLAEAAAILRENGFTEAELDLMFKTNPARLLGLPVD